MSLKCCNRNVQILKTINLFDTITKTHRVLTVGRCKNPNCGALRAQILYYDVNKGKFIHETIKKKDVQKTIQMLQQEPYITDTSDGSKQGSYGNQHWIYGKTVEREIEGEKFLYFYSINFNGEKTFIGRKKINDKHTYSISNSD